MKSKTIATIATYGLLSAVAGVTFMMPDRLTVPSNFAAEEPLKEEVILNGVIRDFHKADPVLVVSPTGGAGHSAGNVQDWLPGTARPVYVAGGKRVATQWRDSKSRPINPHLANVRGGATSERLGLRVNDRIVIEEGTIDAFNSNYGLYGVGGNYGATALLTTNATGKDRVFVDNKGIVKGDVFVGPDSPADVIKKKGVITGAMRAMDEAYTMPEISAPTNDAEYEDLEDHEPEYLLDAGTDTLVGDTTPDDESDARALWFDDFTVRGSVLTIEGDLRIRCDNKLTIENSQIVLAPEANLTFYVGGNQDLHLKKCLINTTTGDTTAVTINYLGTKDVVIEDDSHVYATVVAPSGRLKVKKGHFYGGFIGERLELDDKGAGIHVDMGNAEIGPQNFALTVREKLELDDNSNIDSFDSTKGPYGGTNRDQRALVTTNAIDKDEEVKIKKNCTLGGDLMIGPRGNYSKVVKFEDNGRVTGTVGQLGEVVAIPVVAPPFLAGADSNISYKDEEVTISASFRCKKLKLENRAIMNIDGDVTIRVDDKLEMTDRSEIRLNPGASLTLYIKKDLKLENLCKINANTGDPKRVSIRRTSVGKKGKIEIKQNSAVYAWAQGAKTELKLDDGAEFYGSFIGRKVKAQKNSRIHVDMAYLATCVDVADAGGAWGADTNGGVTSADEFAQWYRDVLGVNQTMGYPVTLTRNFDGVWEFLEDKFHPIDDRLFGNDGEEHNYYYTYMIHAEFEYEECGSQFLEFAGGDGAWLYVNGMLVMDLGGIGAADEQHVDFDRLGLEDESTVDIHFYYAQRQSGDAMFRMRTNVELSSDSAIPNVSAMFD